MGKIISIASQKGGVGKTTTALNLGYSLSRFGDEVLIIDGDPQGGLTVASNLRKKTDLGLIDFLKGECAPGDIIMQTRDKSLSIAGIGRAEPEDVIMLEDRQSMQRIIDLIKQISQDFRYTIIDVPAGLGNLVTALLSASNSVILTLNNKTLSIKTVPGFLKLIKWINQEVNRSLYLEGVLLTMFNFQSESEMKMYDEVQQSFPKEVFFYTAIPYDERFEYASSRSLPVALIKDGLDPAKHYMDLLLELKSRESARGMGGGEHDEYEGLF